MRWAGKPALRISGTAEMKPRGLKTTTTTVRGRKHGAGHPDRANNLPESGRARARREDAREIADWEEQFRWISFNWQHMWL